MQSDIRLQPLDSAVAEALFPLAATKDICIHFFGCSTLTEARWRTWLQGRRIRSHLGLGSSYVITHPVFGPVGYCGLTVEENSADLGYWMAADYRRQGFATSAIRVLIRLGFENPRLDILMARCSSNNLSSIQLLTRLGFRKREGRQRGETQFECSRQSKA